MNFLSNLLKVLGFLPLLISGAENLHGSKCGELKRNVVVDLAGLPTLVKDAVAAEEIVDEKRFNEGLKKVIEGIVEMLNASVWHRGKA